MLVRNLIIFDVDGTLANCSGRQHYLEGDTKNWKLFFQHAEHDEPIAEMIQLLQTLHESRKYRIFLCTGRGEEIRVLTEKWLTFHNIPYERLMMRRPQDRRQDALVKEDMLREIGVQQVLFVVDDRKQAVDMWRKNGVLCLQCDEGNF